MREPFVALKRQTFDALKWRIRRWIGPCLCAGLLSLVPATGAGAAALENEYLSLTGDNRKPGAGLELRNKLTQTALHLSSAAPEFKFEGFTFGGRAMVPGSVQIERNAEGNRLVLRFAPQKGEHYRFELRVFFTLPRDLPILRKHAELKVLAINPEAAPAKVVLERVALLDEPLPEPVSFKMDGWQSYPVFTEQYFFGIEFPAASTLVEDKRLRASHAPGLTADLPLEYRSRDAVIGVAVKGKVREAFEQYVSSFRPIHDRMHFNYNSWWTSPLPFGEEDILGLIRTFDEKLYKPYGVSFDSFTLDMGWSQRQGIWKISEKLFPQGFAPLNAELLKQQSRLGLWWSPSNTYSPGSFDNDWAFTQGYEMFAVARPNAPPHRFACLGLGTKYQRDAIQALCRMVREDKLGQMKFDGYLPTCPDKGHGHLPGELSTEAVAAGMIGVFEALRAANPELWMETTCFGFNASPWWLRYASSVIGPFGDDAPHGAVPAPIYRESYTTSRDFFNLHGSETPVPIAAQEVLGIIHQSDDPMYNDAVTTLLRGHQFISLYLNPKYMGDHEYAFIAALMKWARANAGLLARTKVIWPADWRKSGSAPMNRLKDMPRQTYGYAHWRDGAGLICLRNPWIEMDTIELKLDDATIGIDTANNAKLAALQIYPYQTCLADNLHAGGKLTVKLGPYETKVIRLAADSGGQKPAGDMLGEASRTCVLKSKTSGLVETTIEMPETQPFGDDYTVCSPPKTQRWKSRITGTASETDWQVYYLVESAPPPTGPGTFECTVNGKPAKPDILDWQSGWSSAQSGTIQNTWTWYVVNLPMGEWKADAVIEVPSAQATVSAWLMRSFKLPAEASASRVAPGDAPELPTPPAYRPCVSMPAINMIGAGKLPVERTTAHATIERIQGIYLDRLEPAAASQGWGKLQRNTSVTGMPLRVGARRFHRGLGTHANAKIVYRLDGQYKALHGFGGHQAGYQGSIRMEIHLDGRKVWDTPRLTRDDAPRAFDIPLGNAKELALVVTDSGDGASADHGDWGDVWLEKV